MCVILSVCQPVTELQILSLARLDEHDLCAEEQLAHDVGDEAGVHFGVG